MGDFLLRSPSNLCKAYYLLQDYATLHLGLEDDIAHMSTSFTTHQNDFHHISKWSSNLSKCLHSPCLCKASPGSLLFQTSQVLVISPFLHSQRTFTHSHQSVPLLTYWQLSKTFSINCRHFHKENLSKYLPAFSISPLLATIIHLGTVSKFCMVVSYS